MKVPKIIGGGEVEAHSEPHIVSLQNRSGHFCGASIISATDLTYNFEVELKNNKFLFSVSPFNSHNY